jgi:flagellar FliL protein
MADEKSAEGAKKEEPKGGGIKAMLPLILTVILMPVMAFVMTNFILLPKIQKAIVASASTIGEDSEHSDEETEADSHEPAAEGGHGEAAGEAPKPAKGAKATYQLPKLIVNVRGTMGTRFLMASFTLVGKGSEFITMCENNDAQLRDVAMGVLAGKTIQDLEKPESRNMIRTEMISTFNTALGKPAVNEIYITEFAIQ